MTCKEAIKKWETDNNAVAAEASQIKLYAQNPSIEKMDEALNTLEACEYLSLSTNQIDRMLGLSKLKNLKILSLGRNQIKRIMGLDEVGQTLEQLWLSYNIIEKLDGLQPCIKLHTFYISNNKIKTWDEIGKLSALPEIKNVLLSGNPVYGDKGKLDVLPYVVKRCPQIANVDGELITPEIKKAADSLEG